MNKKGSAMLYVTFSIIAFALIISYILLRTGTAQLSQLTYTKEIIGVYMQNYDNMEDRMQQEYTPEVEGSVPNFI